MNIYLPASPFEFTKSAVKQHESAPKRSNRPSFSFPPFLFPLFCRGSRLLQNA